MKNFCKGFSLLATILLAGGLVGCSDDSPWRGSDTEGGINLTLTADGRISRHASRADDYSSPIVPDGNAFAISLDSHDGSYSKTWTNMESFNKEEGFPIGDYKIGASYGDMDREGFELPHFKGEMDVHVSPGEVTETEIVATLANSMVSVRFTDDFIANFPEYSAAVQTPGHDWVVFTQTETRPAYISPASSDYTKVSVTMTNKNGQRVTVEPAKFQTVARRHYIVTINAVGNVASGDMTLEVEFEEDVVNETVNISLSDDLFNSPAPEIKAKEFTPGQPLSFIAYEELAENPQFDIFGFGGFSEVTMTVSGPSTYNPSFGNPVEFISSESLTRRQLETAGVKVSGLYPVEGLMAVVNVKKYLEQVPPGDYTITLQAKDVQTRLSEPVALKASVAPLQMELSLAEDVSYRAHEVTIVVASNSKSLGNQLSFELTDKDGYPIACEVKSITDITLPGFASAQKCVLSTDPIATAEFKASVNCGRMTKELLVDVVDPEYSVEIDAFAKNVVLHITTDDPDLQNDLVDNLSIYNGTRKVDESRIIRDRNANIITISKTESGIEYKNIKTVLGQFEKVLPAFATESDDDVTNGNFRSRGVNIKQDGVQVGGQYLVSPASYTIKTNINRYEPSGWATVNALTASSATRNMNTWFYVPSSYISGETVVIESVGYNPDGTTPSRTGGAFSTTYYCTNSPSDSELLKAAGELFLGSYPQGGSRSNGITFSSRPSSLSFDYSYSPVNGEQAQVEISVYDATGTILSSEVAYLSATPDMTSYTVNLPAYPFGKKAAKIYVGFRSTKAGVTPSVNIPTGSALNEGQGLGNHTIDDLTFHAVAKGSVLTIDNVSLGYDEVTGVKNIPNNKSKR